MCETIQVSATCPRDLHFSHNLERNNALLKTSRKWFEPVSKATLRSFKLLSSTATTTTTTDMRYGINAGHPTTPIEKVVRPSQRKGVQSTKTKFVRSVIREVAGFSAYERRVMELLRNSKVRLESVFFFSEILIYIYYRIRKLGS